MRKMKKINGYLVVRFNDREKREYEGTGLGSYGVIDAEQYTGILDIDRSVMEYDDADTLEMAMEQARELESELDIVEPETKITVIIEGETEVSEEDVEPERLFRQQKAQLENQLQRGPHMDLTPLTAAHELYGYTRALADLGMIDSHDERFMVERDIFGASAQPPDCQEEDLAYICDELCKYREGRTQEDLDAICAKCRVDRKAGAPPTLTPREVRDLRSLFRMMEEVEDYVNGGDDQKPTPHHLHRGAAERMIQRLEMKLPEGTTLKTIQDLMDTSPSSEPPREKFRHIPEAGNNLLGQKVYQLGLAMEADCPNNDCTIYRNTFQMARELDETLDGAQGYAAEVLQRELWKHVRELRRMYYENNAVKTYREGVR